LWSGEGLFIGIFEAQNLGGGKILPPPDQKPGGGAIAPAAPPSPTPMGIDALEKLSSATLNEPSTRRDRREVLAAVAKAFAVTQYTDSKRARVSG